MDFIAIIRSLEELLYEVMSWLIFYPRTLWRTFCNPAAVTAYSDKEQNDLPDERYTDTLSPPLLLMITMVLTYVLSHWIGSAEPMATTEVGKAVTDSAKNLLLMRALIFAIVPLVIAAIGLRGSGILIDRKTLRQPFYSQCFLVTPFALLLQSAFAVYQLPGYGGLAGLNLGLGAFLWFGWAQTGWFASRLKISLRVAAIWAVAAITSAVLTGGGITYLVAKSL
ncbi:hypothetical protein [Tabrizicola sp.]|uniref:hypothetical protein n=1 Tax=Tabrizicola sp. TaxID=2005166 RepID=UPI0025CDBBD5|nr:hypothetical protein [Tabrizicola sp.]